MKRVKHEECITCQKMCPLRKAAYNPQKAAWDKVYMTDPEIAVLPAPRLPQGTKPVAVCPSVNVGIEMVVPAKVAREKKNKRYTEALMAYMGPWAIDIGDGVSPRGKMQLHKMPLGIKFATLMVAYRQAIRIKPIDQVIPHMLVGVKYLKQFGKSLFDKGYCWLCGKSHIRQGDTITRYGAGWAERDCFTTYSDMLTPMSQMRALWLTEVVNVVRHYHQKDIIKLMVRYSINLGSNSDKMGILTRRFRPSDYDAALGSMFLSRVYNDWDKIEHELLPEMDYPKTERLHPVKAFVKRDGGSNMYHTLNGAYIVSDMLGDKWRG